MSVRHHQKIEAEKGLSRSNRTHGQHVTAHKFLDAQDESLNIYAYETYLVVVFVNVY